MRIPAGFVVLVAACGGASVTVDGGAADDGGAAPGADASVAASGCSADKLAACVYTSDLKFTVDTADLVLNDAARKIDVPIRVHYPHDTSGAAHPVVIWSHGGLPGPNASTRSEEWGVALAAAGYVVVHPGRNAVDPAAFTAPCAAAGFTDPAICAVFIGNAVFGPKTAVFAANSLAAIQAATTVVFDTTKIVMAGHSAGSVVPLALAGAVRHFNGLTSNDRDMRPVAFLATGPHGADYASFEDGFGEDSFHSIDGRPFLFISGRGDETGDVGEPQHEPSEGRTIGWLTSTRGGKYLSWDNDEIAVHETMDIHKCDQAPVQQLHCNAFAMLGVAYLDAVVRARAEAIAYMASSDYETLSHGVIELHGR